MKLAPMESRKSFCNRSGEKCKSVDLMDRIQCFRSACVNQVVMELVSQQWELGSRGGFSARGSSRWGLSLPALTRSLRRKLGQRFNHGGACASRGIGSTFKRAACFTSAMLKIGKSRRKRVSKR